MKKVLINIKSLRINAGLSQTQLGKLAGLPVRNISYWEAGHGDPPISACLKLAEAMNVTLEELVSAKATVQPQ